MNMKFNQNHSKEIKPENLLALKEAIDSNSINDLIEFNKEWGGAYVIITSNPDKVFDPEKDEEDWFGRKASCTYVLTKHSIALSKFFKYVDESIMVETDYYLYGFMALLANDFIKEFGDSEDYSLMLNYIFSGVLFYLKYYDGKSAMGNPKKAFKLMKFFLSEKTSDEEIKKIL